MATILEFRSEPEKAPLKLTCRRRRTAEIVIFPGVRYERAHGDQAGSSSASRIERDTLKLVD